MTNYIAARIGMLLGAFLIIMIGISLEVNDWFYLAVGISYVVVRVVTYYIYIRRSK